PRGHALQRGLVRVEDGAVAAVADRVRAYLKAGAQRALGELLNCGLRRHHQPAVALIVAVRLEQRRAARAERTVDVEFDRANRKMTVAMQVASTAAQVLRHEPVVA